MIANKSKIAKVFIFLFSIIWSLFLLVDYINHSPSFVEAIKHNEYFAVLIAAIILALGLTYLFSGRLKGLNSSIEIKGFRHFYHYLFILILIILTMLVYLSKVEIVSNPASGALAFLFRSIMFHTGAVVVFFASLNIGGYVLRLVMGEPSNNIDLLIRMAVGLFLLAFCCFLLGTINFLNKSSVLVVIVLFSIPGLKSTLSDLNQSLFSKVRPFKVNVITVVCYTMLLLVLAVNLCYLIRPFPIGYDDLVLYMNVPSLLSEYQGLITGGNAYNWSIIMSLGFIVFDSATIAILLSVIPGMLSIIIIYRICIKLGLSVNWAVVASSLFSTYPIVIWQSRFEAKVDFAFLFISLCCLYLILDWNKIALQFNSVKTKKVISSADLWLWMLCGVLMGFSMGIKYLTLISIFSFVILIFYRYAGKFAAISAFFLNFVLIFLTDLPSMAAFEQDQMLLRVLVPSVFFVIFFTIALRRNRTAIYRSLKFTFVFCAISFLVFSPWMIKHMVENEEISLNSALTGRSELPQLYEESNHGFRKEAKNASRSINRIANDPSNITSASLDLNIKNAVGSVAQNEAGSEENKWKKPPLWIPDIEHTSKKEEIQRYLGYETGIVRFLSYPYDNIMKINVEMWASDFGILIFLMMSILIFNYSSGKIISNSIKVILLVILLTVSIISVHYSAGSLDIDVILQDLKSKALNELPLLNYITSGFYVFIYSSLLSFGELMLPYYSMLTMQDTGTCFVLLILFSIPIYYLYRHRLVGLNTNSKALVVVAFSTMQYWYIVSSGIIWYGILGFALLAVLISILTSQALGVLSDRSSFIKYTYMLLMSIWLSVIIPFQLFPISTSVDKANNKEESAVIFPKAFAEFAIGKASKEDVFTRLMGPFNKEILKTLNSNEDKILNISTTLLYYIENNNKRVYQDPQIGLFMEVYNRSNEDKDMVAKELRRLGLRYILVNLRTPSIDVTQEKSLQKKYLTLMNTLTNNQGIRLLYTDNIVERPDGTLTYNINGKTLRGMYHLQGLSVIQLGTVALFEII